LRSTAALDRFAFTRFDHVRAFIKTIDLHHCDRHSWCSMAPYAGVLILQLTLTTAEHARQPAPTSLADFLAQPLTAMRNNRHAVIGKGSRNEVRVHFDRDRVGHIELQQ
jgi:hypothetical protein